MRIYNSTVNCLLDRHLGRGSGSDRQLQPMIGRVARYPDHLGLAVHRELVFAGRQAVDAELRFVRGLDAVLQRELDFGQLVVDHDRLPAGEAVADQLHVQTLIVMDDVQPRAQAVGSGVRVRCQAWKNLDTHNSDTLLSLSLRNDNLALRKRPVTIE